MGKDLLLALVTFLVVVVASAPAWGIQPTDPEPGAGRAVPRRDEERDPVRGRRPGTLLSQAEHHPSQIDPAELRRRRIDQVANRAFYTDSPAAAEESAEPEATTESDAASAAPAAVEGEVSGLRTWHVLAFVALTGLGLAAAFRFTRRR